MTDTESIPYYQENYCSFKSNLTLQLYLYRGQNGKVATERVVRRNYSEVALPMENPFVGSSPTVQTSNGECPVVMITPAAED